MFSSYYTLHPVLYTKLIDITDTWEMPGTMFSHFPFSGMSAMSRLQVCAVLSLYPYGRLMEIVLLAYWIFFTGVPGRPTCSLDIASAMDSCLVKCISYVDY